MRVSRHLLTPPLLVLLAVPSFAWTVPPQLLQAQHLSETGQSHAAISLLEPLVQPGSHVFDEANRGIAWNLLGNAYSDFENYDKARRCYETAIHILREIPAEQVQYASALDNLGSIESSIGHLEESKTLRSKAKRLYEALGNHAGIAIASNDLAVIALKQNDLRAAHRNLEETFREAQLTKDLTDNNLATMYTTKGTLVKAERDLHKALAAYQQAIDLWTRGYGPHFFMLGAAYALRGQLYDDLGDHQRAISDMQHALALLEETPGRNTPTYLTIELSYAYILRSAGSKQEASLLEKQAKTGMANLRVQQCSGCTISAESFR
jgi:tetratricopeptide (TPR) repeat protein